MPTALMENLLDGGRKKQIPAQKAAWCLDDEDDDDNQFEVDAQMQDETQESCDEDDEEYGDEAKIPKKTEIFEGQVV